MKELIGCLGGSLQEISDRWYVIIKDWSWGPGRDFFSNFSGQDHPGSKIPNFGEILARKFRKRDPGLVSSDNDDYRCEGNGPLAQWMSASDVKQLIRALFQNTQRRANILARIN
jgi:hypothetical protein